MSSAIPHFVRPRVSRYVNKFSFTLAKVVSLASATMASVVTACSCTYRFVGRVPS